MIISASYKTDIPAFYSSWFQHRLQAGFCKMVNPYGGQVYDVSLRPEDVQGFVFWSRNYQAFLDKNILDDLSAPFVCHMSITGYPSRLDQATISAEKAINQLHDMALRYGVRRVVWRYDPIVLTDGLDGEWHLNNFNSIADQLKGIVDEVVVSFVQFYKKTRQNFQKGGIQAFDPDNSVKQKLLLQLHDIADASGIRLSLCAQPELLVGPILPSACIDVDRLSDLAQKPLYVSRKPHRAQCGCVSSKDIGAYDTCPHGCLYCYGVKNRQLAKDRFHQHDPKSAFLFEPRRSTS